jgi:hypothetical protein
LGKKDFNAIILSQKKEKKSGVLDTIVLIPVPYDVIQLCASQKFEDKDSYKC